MLVSKLNPYANEITGENQCGFRQKGSTND